MGDEDARRSPHRVRGLALQGLHTMYPHPQAPSHWGGMGLSCEHGSGEGSGATNSAPFP